MNPYAAPISPEVEPVPGHPDFRLIPSFAWKVWAPFLIAMSISSSSAILNSPGHTNILKEAVTLSIVPVLGCLTVLWCRMLASRNDRRVQAQPLVRSGEAMAGGTAYWGATFRRKSGSLLLTRYAVVFFRHADDGNAEPWITVPLTDIASVTFGRLEPYIQIHLHTGESWSFVVIQRKRWAAEIGRVLSFSLGRPPGNIIEPR